MWLLIFCYNIAGREKALSAGGVTPCLKGYLLILMIKNHEARLRPVRSRQGATPLRKPVIDSAAPDQGLVIRPHCLPPGREPLSAATCRASVRRYPPGLFVTGGLPVKPVFTMSCTDGTGLVMPRAPGDLIPGDTGRKRSGRAGPRSVTAAQGDGQNTGYRIDSANYSTAG